MMTGRIIRVPIDDIDPQSRYLSEIKLAITTGSVFDLNEVRVAANINSFQENIHMNIAVTEIPGKVSGNVT